MNNFLIFIVLILIVFYLFYRYYQRSFEYWAKRNVAYLKPSFPFGNYNSKMVTELGILTWDIYKDLRKTKAKYGGLYMFTSPVFVPLSPEMYKEVLIRNFQYFHDFGIHFDEDYEPLSAFLVALTGSKWKYVRNKLAPAFSTVKLKNMFPIMNQCAGNLSDIVKNSALIDFHDLATRYTTDMICTCAFGIEAGSLQNPDAEFKKYGEKIVNMNYTDTMRLIFAMSASGIMKKLKIGFINPLVSNFFYKIVVETITYREKNNIRRNDLMDSLIRLKNKENIDETIISTNEDNQGLTLNQITAQVIFFYWAGFETSAMTLACCMYELAKQPNLQQKLRDEIVNHLQKNNGEITFEAINNMPYADKVIQETMRMYPPVAILNRVCTQDFHIPDSSVIIEEGTRVVISVLGVHYDPEYYPQPYKFDPERFSEEEKAKRPHMSYLPFGEGPRICLGQKFAMAEMKLALVYFLRDTQYSVHPLTKQQIKLRSYANLLGLKDKIWLKATKL